MSVHVREEQRRLLPRWRESAIAGSSAELTPLPSAAGRTVAPIDTAAVEARLSEWRAAPSLGTAADAVAVGFVSGAPALVRQPAEYLLANAEQVGAIGIALAHRVLGTSRITAPGSELDSTRSERRTINHRVAIASLRARLIRTPRDPLAYLDLARRYAALGQTGRASTAVRAALALAPESRLVLRSASRFFVHAGDPERAQELFHRSPRTRTDPWLMAAEISAATVADRPSRLIKLGREMVVRAALPAIHLSELAGALGTLEMLEGNPRAARRYFAQSMIAPTDNSLAQAQWAVPQLGLRDLPEIQAVPRAFEADALSAVRDGEWQRALDACFQWLDDEPFSHKSAALGSFVASTGQGDHGEAIVIATEGLTANPSDQLLRNNLVFSLASDGQLPRALVEAQSVEPRGMDADTLVAWTATVGLLNYRLGERQLGREYYQAAIEAATRQGKVVMAAMAALYWALASLSVGDEDSEQVREAALSRASSLRDPAVSTLRERVAAHPPRAATSRDSRSPGRAETDL